MVFSEEGQVTRKVSWRAGEWSVFAPRAVSMDVRSGGSPFTVSAHTKLIPVQTLDAVGREHRTNSDHCSSAMLL